MCNPYQFLVRKYAATAACPRQIFLFHPQAYRNICPDRLAHTQFAITLVAKAHSSAGDTP
jgi:hypothetical protein